VAEACGAPTHGALKNHVVLYRPADALPLDEPLGFQCWADDGDHAEEQCLDANRDADVVWIWQGEFGIGVQPALDDYYSGGLAPTHASVSKERDRG